MIAMLWAQQIMLSKKTYAEVPRLLKDKVKEILQESGYGELAVETKLAAYDTLSGAIHEGVNEA